MFLCILNLSFADFCEGSLTCSTFALGYSNITFLIVPISILLVYEPETLNKDSK